MIKHKIAKLGISIVVAGLLVSGCTNSSVAKKEEVVKPALAAEDIGLRKVSVYEDTSVADKTQYADNAAGSGVKFKRAYQDAPPMIPHDTTGMMEITRDNNQCVSCHMPEVAVSMGATPVPTSHFMDFRPRHKLVEGEKFVKTVNEDKNEVKIKKLDDLAAARFNCVQCHAPQSQGEAPLNVFEPDFIDKDGTAKSNWTGDRLLEGLNTLGK